MKKRNIIPFVFFVNILSSCNLQIKYGSNILYGESLVNISTSLNTTIIPSNLTSEVMSTQKEDSFIRLSTVKTLIYVGDSIELNFELSPNLSINDLEFEIIDGDDYVEIRDFNYVYAIREGISHIIAHCGEIYSNSITICVEKEQEINVSLTIYCSNNTLNVGENSNLSTNTMPSGYEDYVIYEIISGSECGYIIGSTFFATKQGYVNIIGRYNNWTSNAITIAISDSNISEDPYISVDVNEFYANYKPATSYLDSYYRSLHNLMSGSIDEQDQTPTINNNRPIINGKYVKNQTTYFSSDSNTYYVLNSQGIIVNEIYRGGAYVTLEDVAAYIFAFGDVPSNYISENKATVSNYAWGKYLRLNHTYFSGDNSRYPYEPALPRISGIADGDLKYYEVDIGTTGTDCDPNYTASNYNNGYTITRGAARIVYSRFYNNYLNTPIDLADRYVFYTYNHYNDFQEYLNYQNGWGEMFGNVTGGGTLSSKSDYNPTPYIEVYSQNFSINNARLTQLKFPKKKYEN